MAKIALNDISNLSSSSPMRNGSDYAMYEETKKSRKIKFLHEFCFTAELENIPHL